MGFLDGLCDSPDGEAGFSWHDFWHLDNVCSLTTLGAVVAGLVALLSFVAMLVQYGCSSNGGGCRTTGYANKLWNRVSDGGGREETKGSHADDYGGGNFASSAAEPLLAGHDSSAAAAGAGGDGDDIANSFFGVMAATTDENDNEARKVGGAGGKKTPKKGTGVHWLKLLLYWIQAGYHLSVGAFTLVDGRADNNPYKCEFPYCCTVNYDVRYHTLWTDAPRSISPYRRKSGNAELAARRESPPKMYGSFDVNTLLHGGVMEL